MPTKPQRDYIFDLLGYKPTLEQLPVHDCEARTKLVAGGERGGKSKLSAMELLSRFYEGSLYWLVAADYGRTRAEYDYLCDGFDRLGWEYTATKHIDPGEINVAGGFCIRTKSALDPRKLAMEAPDGILACEASQLSYEDFLRLKGRLAEKRGWLLMSGTFESSLGWYPELYQRWLLPNNEDARSFSLPSWSNKYIYPGGREDPEIKNLERLYSTDWFAERCGGIPVPPRGRVFPEFQLSIHTGTGKLFDFDPSLDTYIWTDPGYAGACAVEVIQKREESIFVVDEVFETGLVTSEIITVCQQKPWYKKVIGGVIDIYGIQHQSMPAPVEIWLKEGKLHLRSKKIREKDGRERLKASLKINPLTGSPGIFINTKCKGLISELGGCPNPLDGQTKVYKWRMDRENNIIGDAPEDKNNHAIKAVIYGLVDLIGYSTARQSKAKVKYY